MKKNENPTKWKERAQGCLYGLAIGDAIGAPAEFMRPGSFEAITGYSAGGVHDLQPGQWTDDTSMALALATSIAKKGWNLNDQMSRYVDWWMNGKYSWSGTCLDIGVTTLEALERFLETADAHTSGDPSHLASGNGSIMRLAAVPIRFHSLLLTDIERLVQYLRESSVPTHRSPQCISACVYLGLILSGLISGIDREEVLDPEWKSLRLNKNDWQLDPLILEIARGSYRRKQPPEIEASGHVVKTLEAALWAFHKADSFEEGVLRAVNLGHDADTVGAVTGQLCGAYWGINHIPMGLINGLESRDLLDDALTGLLNQTAANGNLKNTKEINRSKRLVRKSLQVNLLNKI